MLGNVEIEDVTVPAGDPGEQLIAYLILSTIAFDLRSDTTARRHLTQAYILAMDLADQSRVYRPPRPSQLARLTCEFDGLTETILLPVIGNILVFPAIAPVLPAIAAEDITGALETTSPAVNIKTLEIARFMLRLRPGRVASILESLGHAASSQQLTDATRRILAACTRHELPVGGPLERANDFFTLAHDLIGKRNFPLATLALGNADRALEDAYAQTASSSDRAAAILQMKQRVAEILGELKRTAM